ncbi:MAG: helix-turn-helix domain-containing protein [Pseudobdellovibrionaceae bacterium]
MTTFSQVNNSSSLSSNTSAVAAGLQSTLMASTQVSPLSTSAPVTALPATTDSLFVANLHHVSLEKLVKSKLEVLFNQQKEAQVELTGLYNIVIEQVEKPLIELALRAYNGNQVKTAQMLGINRNTLKKKIDIYKIRVKKVI